MKQRPAVPVPVSQQRPCPRLPYEQNEKNIFTLHRVVLLVLVRLKEWI